MRIGGSMLALFPKSAGPYPYLWVLLWFPQYFFNIIQVDGKLDKAVGLAAGLILLYVFRQMYWAENWSLVIYFSIGLAVLSATAALTDPMMFFYTILLVMLFGYADRPVQLTAGLVILILAFSCVSWFTEGNLSVLFQPYFFSLLMIELIVPIVIFIFERTKSLHRQLDSANERIVALTREQERNRFARDLHDTLGHTLTMIIMKSELASRLIEKDGQKAKKEINEVQRISREALKQTRALVSSARQRSLAGELEEARRILVEKGIVADMRLPEKWPLLQKKDEAMVALALREAVTNIVRHSAAVHCLIHVYVDSDGKLIIHIADDGNGIETTHHSGSGLHTIQERMKLIGGSAAFLSEGGGTSVRLSLPLHHKREGDGA